MKLSDLRKLGKEATAGPWEWEDRTENVQADGERWVHIPQGSHLGPTLICLDNDYEGYAADCDLLAAARNHWDALLNIADALEAISCNLNEGEDLHYANDVLARLEAIK